MDLTSSAVIRGLSCRTWRVLLALSGFFGCLLVVGLGVGRATASLPTTISFVIAGVVMSASTLGMVLLLRRHVDRGTWRGTGLSCDRRTLPQLLLGVALAAAVTAVAGGITVWLGHADWGRATATTATVGLTDVIVTTTASTLLVQGFPEELVFRGYVFGNLREVQPLWAAAVVSSVLFGSIHVLSHSGATTLGQRLTYAATATGFGLVLAACRTASGALWLGTGFHAGHDAFTGVLVTVHRDALVPALLVALGTLLTTAAITFAAHRRRTRKNSRSA
ncbi:CPBP family intramembrane glutamic endopeptidase [Umezawaea beigongshangensis]|uniref:CPBP family intramembrane glutamic endopeptidase n=1 Tax=Umezawaea beigongshangensis TaxID=2780383 RepID=UPI0018F225F3|nr:CPBP family intramembrane glutamic endopeptidase [Umezawaea beigongshangensis]